MQCQNTRFFKWPAGAKWGVDDFSQGRKGKNNDDGAGMPLVLTSSGGGTLVASPLSDFFTSAQTLSESTGNFSFGIHGKVRLLLLLLLLGLLLGLRLRLLRLLIFLIRSARCPPATCTRPFSSPAPACALPRCAGASC